MDLTKIPEFHPRVFKVDLIDGKAFREPGAAYQCHLSGGKHTCIEKDIEIVPVQKIVTVLPEDTFRRFLGCRFAEFLADSVGAARLAEK